MAKFNAEFWRNGKLLSSGYGSSRGIAMQSGARKLTEHTTNNSRLEDITIIVREVGALKMVETLP